MIFLPNKKEEREERKSKGLLTFTSEQNRTLKKSEAQALVEKRSMELDLENPLTGGCLEEYQSDTVPTLFALEVDHMPCDNYVKSLKSEDFDVSIRRQLVSLILHAHLSCNLDPFIPYLAVNYIDRFICKQGIPQGKPWILKLIAMSCLSIAAKMKKQTDFSVSDFQGEEEGFIFDSQTIQRMELLILGALQWRMRSITPFSFLHFFASLFKLKDPPFLQALKARATEILFKAQNESKLLEFKPSIVAASALLSASHELFPVQFHCYRLEISSCLYVNKEKLFECCNAMQDLVMEGYESVLDLVLSTDTPVNVLDHHWSSSESERTTLLSEQREMKRRKIGRGHIL